MIDDIKLPGASRYLNEIQRRQRLPPNTFQATHYLARLRWGWLLLVQYTEWSSTHWHSKSVIRTALWGLGWTRVNSRADCAKDTSADYCGGVSDREPCCIKSIRKSCSWSLVSSDLQYAPFVADQCTRSSPSSFRKDLFNIAQTTISSKVLSQDKAYFANLAVYAVLWLKVRLIIHSFTG